MEKLQHEQDQKISELKMRFFTNISHEFRTPITLILAPLKEILNKKDTYNLNEELAHKISLAQNNSLRLMKLVNQLLDFRKTESGNMTLFASLTNLKDFVQEICFPFYELAKINNINLRFKSTLKTEEIWLDRDKLEIVLNNLISNAFKYLKENGKIEISLYEEEEEVLISVSDNGPGIPATEINQIFERFYRIGKSDDEGSSGIGLALSKTLVELHKGTITVTSEPKINTEFVVALLKGKKHLISDEMDNQSQVESVPIKNEGLFTNVLPSKPKRKVNQTFEFWWLTTIKRLQVI